MFKWKRYMVAGLVIVLLMTDPPVWAAEPAETELYAKAAVLMDAESGRVLYEKNGKEILAMASTTKILTCILALEKADLKPEEVWYIGDNYTCDVNGARSAGIFPVWYIGAIDLPYEEKEDVLTVRSWAELKNVMSGSLCQQ